MMLIAYDLFLIASRPAFFSLLGLHYGRRAAVPGMLQVMVRMVTAGA